MHLGLVKQGRNGAIKVDLWKAKLDGSDIVMTESETTLNNNKQIISEKIDDDVQ